MPPRNHASRFEGISKTKIARFPHLKPQNLAISNTSLIEKSTLHQAVRHSSRTTKSPRQREAEKLDAIVNEFKEPEEKEKRDNALRNDPMMEGKK
jgi:hypothetical protein